MLQQLLRTVGLSQGEVGIRQADVHNVIIRAACLRALKIFCRQIVLADRHHDVRGSQQIFRRDRVGFSYARFGKSQADLLLGVRIPAFAGKQVSKSQPRLHPVRIRASSARL